MRVGRREDGSAASPRRAPGCGSAPRERSTARAAVLSATDRDRWTRGARRARSPAREPPASSCGPSWTGAGPGAHRHPNRGHSSPRSYLRHSARETRTATVDGHTSGGCSDLPRSQRRTPGRGRDGYHAEAYRSSRRYPRIECHLCPATPSARRCVRLRSSTWHPHGPRPLLRRHKRWSWRPDALALLLHIPVAALPRLATLGLGETRCRPSNCPCRRGTQPSREGRSRVGRSSVPRQLGPFSRSPSSANPSELAPVGPSEPAQEQGCQRDDRGAERRHPLRTAWRNVELDTRSSRPAARCLRKGPEAAVSGEKRKGHDGQRHWR